MNKILKSIIIGTLSLPATVVKADSCSDYNLKIRYPAYIKAVEVHQEILKNAGTNTSKLLKQYESLISDLAEIEEYKYKIETNFSDRCIGRGRLTRTTFYLDNDKDVMMSYVGSQDRNEFLKTYLIPAKTWPEALDILISDIHTKQASIKKQIIAATNQQQQKEQERQKLLDQQQKELDELKQLSDAANHSQMRNDHKEVELTKSKQEQQKPLVKKNPTKSESYYTDRMAGYATIIGRATACGSDPTMPIEHVGNWMDNWFSKLNISSKMRSTYLTIFMSGTQHHMEQQLQGNTPDTCQTTVSSFNKTLWP